MGEQQLSVFEFCAKGDWQRLTEYIAAGGDLTLLDQTGQNLLHYCSRKSESEDSLNDARIACAKSILDACPSLSDAFDQDGMAPLHHAIIHDNLALVELLLDYGTPIDLAMKLDKEKRPICPGLVLGRTVCHLAVMYGKIDLLRSLLHDHKCNANLYDDQHAYPIHYAVQLPGLRSVEAINLLVFAGSADKNVLDVHKRTPLIWAATIGQKESVKYLLEIGADSTLHDKSGLTALHCASSKGHLKVVEALVSHDKSLQELEDSDGCTPLFYCVTMGHKDVVDLLIENGADASKTEDKDRSLCHCVTRPIEGQLAVAMLRKLVLHGADPWSPNSQGDTPLHEACQVGNLDIVNELALMPGFKDHVNQYNCAGMTALHLAVLSLLAQESSDLQPPISRLCQVLIKNNADISIPCKTDGPFQGLTPLQLIEQHSFVRGKSCHICTVEELLHCEPLPEEETLERDISSDEKEDTDTLIEAEEPGNHKLNERNEEVEEEEEEKSNNHETETEALKQTTELPPTNQNDDDDGKEPEEDNATVEQEDFFADDTASIKSIKSTETENRETKSVQEMVVVPCHLQEPENAKLVKLTIDTTDDTSKKVITSEPSSVRTTLTTKSMTSTTSRSSSRSAKTLSSRSQKSTTSSNDTLKRSISSILNGRERIPAPSISPYLKPIIPEAKRSKVYKNGPVKGPTIIQMVPDVNQLWCLDKKVPQRSNIGPKLPVRPLTGVDRQRDSLMALHQATVSRGIVKKVQLSVSDFDFIRIAANIADRYGYVLTTSRSLSPRKGRTPRINAKSPMPQNVKGFSDILDANNDTLVRSLKKPPITRSKSTSAKLDSSSRCSFCHHQLKKPTKEPVCESLAKKSSTKKAQKAKQK
ncbi:hypothetical protein Ciccas_008023 [Cichlidogyrus casuarinus]|uniref:Uncharacterized protein n=1 Tax=Cichlidogyrus casuarinus TaxID=1844966 RepID=A0ABD2Q172_9PLAT